MKKIIQKYRNKYPRWLFLWLIKKYWLFPEPMVLSDRLFISSTMAMQISGRMFENEVRNRLIQSLWDTVEVVWLRYSYTPLTREIDFTQQQDFETEATILTWKMICTYSPYRNFNYFRDLIEEIERFVTPSK